MNHQHLPVTENEINWLNIIINIERWYHFYNVTIVKFISLDSYKFERAIFRLFQLVVIIDRELIERVMNTRVSISHRTKFRPSINSNKWIFVPESYPGLVEMSDLRIWFAKTISIFTSGDRSEWKMSSLSSCSSSPNVVCSSLSQNKRQGNTINTEESNVSFCLIELVDFAELKQFADIH